MRHQRLITRGFVAFALSITFGALSSTAYAVIVKGETITDVCLNKVAKTVDLSPISLGLSLAPAVVVGGNQTTATITLSTAAPTGGIEITLKSLNSPVARFGGAFAAIGTSQLRIPEGSVSATFPVRTFGVSNRTDVTLQAISFGEVASATVTVNPTSVKTLALVPGRVVGGASATGTVTLDGLAPANSGVMVQLSVRQVSTRGLPADSSPPASVPASVTVPPGSSSATFVLSTNPVGRDASAILGAATVGQVSSQPSGLSPITDGTSNTIVFGESAASSPIAVLMISAPVASNLTINPQAVPGGALATGTVVLTGKAPASGITLGLSRGSIDTSVPPSVNIPAGADRQNFQITTHSVGSSRTVTINVLALQQLGLDGHVVGPSISDGSSNTIIAGGPVSANLTITPSLTLTAQPSPATGGAPVAITLSVQPDPADSSAVALTTDHPELLQVPSSLAVSPQTAGGLQTIIVNASTGITTTDQVVTLTAARGSISTSTTILIKQTPPPISSFTVRPTTVTGGLNIISQLKLSNTAPASVAVSLTTDHPELVTVPATVTIARSAIPSTLTFRTSATSAPATVTITASTGTQTTSATVNVVP